MLVCTLHAATHLIDCWHTNLRSRVLCAQELLKKELQRVEDEIMRVSSPGKAPTQAPQAKTSSIPRDSAAGRAAGGKGAGSLAPSGPDETGDVQTCVMQLGCVHYRMCSL